MNFHTLRTKVVRVQLWCKLGLCSGFDLCEVGQEEVVLKTGKQASRRIMHYALQSLLALFGEDKMQIAHVNMNKFASTVI